MPARPVDAAASLLRHVSQLSVAALETVPQILIANASILAVILVLAVGAIALQESFLWSIPALIYFAAPITLLLDLFFIMLKVFLESVAIGWDLIAEVLRILNLAKLPMLPVWPFSGPGGVLKLPTEQGVKAELLLLHQECGGPGFFDPYVTFNYLLVQISGNWVCAQVRFLYPIPWLFDAAEALLSPFYLGSAVPATAPGDGGENCLLAGNEIERDLPSPICIALACGWVLLEIVLPAYFLLIFLAYCGGPLFRVVWSLLGFVLKTIKELLQ